MSRTVSFRCSEALNDFLEAEAERRMTTKSTVAQMIVAEYARDSGLGETGESERQEASEGADMPEGDPLDRHPDAWYEPNSDKYQFAVYIPDDAGTHDAGKPRYYKTRGGAAEALTRWYE